MEKTPMPKGPVCAKCNGTFIVKESNGSVHTCFDCLRRGEMDQHVKNVKDSGIRI